MGVWLGSAALALSFSAPARADGLDRNSEAEVSADTRGSASGDIVVTGEKVRSEAGGGTKTDTPLIETPQSISVVSGDDISDFGIQNLNQALRFVAGVTPEQRGASAEVYDQFALRGFAAPRYLDGLRIFDSPTGYADTQIDVSRIDRYEIVKGPASALYGQSSPGGLVAISSKLPLQRAFYGALAGTYGNYDLYRIDADLGGRSGAVAYRLYGSVNGADTQQRYGKRRRQTISGAVTLGGDTPTSFTVLAAYSHDPYNGNYSVQPASGTLFANPNGKVPTRFTGSEPGDRFRREQAGLTYLFRHEFGGDWAFRSLGRYQYVSSALGLYYVTGFPTDAAQRIVNRASYATREGLNSWTFDNQLTGTVVTGPVRHNLLFSADRQVLHATEHFAFGGATPIDVYAPVYGTSPTIAPGDVAAVKNPFSGDYAPRVRQQGVYAQDQLALGDARLTLSGRYDWARTALYGTPQKDEKFTYRVGALYLLPFGLSPYASYSTSFQPQTGLVSDDGGTSFRDADPTLGRQIEAGAKYQPPGTQILVTAAWFRIEQTDVLTSVPIGGYSTQSGKVRSKGVEIEASAPLPYGFNTRLAFSRQKVRVVADADPAKIGGKVQGVGKGNLTAFVEWAPDEGPLTGFAIGGDVRHVDKVYAGSALFTAFERPGGYETPSYTVFDALIRYDLGKAASRLGGVTLQVNATNLFDKKHLTSCYLDFVAWCWYGNRRTVQGTIAYKW